MNLGARLARLEARAASVVRCAWCRYHLVNITPERRERMRRAALEGERPVLYAWATCRWRGNQYRQTVGRLTPREAESLRLWSHTFDGETYTDERAYAALCWWRLRWGKQDVERADEGAPRPAANPQYRGNYGRGRQERPKESKAVRARRELKEEADALVREAQAREARLYGPRSFLLEETLRGLRGDCERYAHLYDEEDGHRARSPEEIKTRRLLAYARCMEACELVLWGEAEEATARALETLPAEIERLEGAGRTQKREKEERQRLERLGVTRPAPARPAQPAEESTSRDEPAPEGPAEAPLSIEDIIASYCPGYVRGEGMWPGEHGGLERVVVPDVPPPTTKDVGRLPDHLKYRAPRWEGDTTY